MRKASGEVVPIAANIDFYPQLIRFETSLAQYLKGRGLLKADTAGEHRLEALELAFSAPLERTPPPGINLHGHIDELPVDEWVDFLVDSGGSETTKLNWIDLEIDRAQAWGRVLGAVDVEVHKADNLFLGLIDASIAKGRFTVPLKPWTNNPVVVSLDYLFLDKLDRNPDFTAFLPSELPPIRVTSESLRYHDMLFSDLTVAARPSGNTLVVDEFSLRRSSIYLNGKGRWKYNPANQQHLSGIDATIKGPELGQAMVGLGFGDSMTDGEVDFNGSFAWSAPLFSFSLENLAGKFRMKIYDGVLNNVEPGTGRFVGLLSLTAIPRRLSLDFSDVLIDGMEFEKIDGDYHISDGVLYTENTRMEGPAAKIKISGKTGIIARDYDQLIQVTPKIRQTLPLVGAVAAGSTVGWGLLLLQNLFKKVIDDAVEVEYRITGSWDDPKIDLIKAVDENQKELPKIDK